MADKIIFNDHIRKYKLGKGKTAFFRLVPGPINKTTGRPYIPGMLVPQEDQIRDEDGSWKEIKLVKRYLPNDRYELDEIWFGPENSGVIVLSGDIAGDEAKYDYMMNSNYNKSNEHRDPTKPAIFYLVDDERDAKAALAAEQQNLAIGAYALHSPIGHLRDALATLGIKVAGMTENQVRDAAMKFGKKNPEGLMATRIKPDRSIEDKVNKLIEINELTYDGSSGWYMWGGENVAYVTRNTPKEKKPGKLVEFIMSDEGEALFNRIESYFKAMG